MTETELLPSQNRLSELTTSHTGDVLEVLKTLPAESVHCCVTSPPYFGLRSYLPKDHPLKSQEVGTERTPQEYVDKLVAVFREVYRVLRDDGCTWLNLGDSYAAHGSGAAGKELKYMGESALDRQSRKPPPGYKAKDLLGIPWTVAFALRSDGWYLRSDIIWHKPSVMPSSVRDRCTTAHEYLFLLTKSPTYYFDAEAIKEDCAESSKQRYKYAAADGKINKAGAYAEIAAAGVDCEITGHNLSRTKNPSVPAAADKRNKRSVWTIPNSGFKGAHFACFPPKLVEPCVLAGTSAHGVCDQCGSPWKRLVERKRTPTRPGTDSKVTGDSSVDGNRDPQRHTTATKTVGWEAGCDCGGAVVPATVLDPFGGSGTVSQVCEQHGRRSVLIDINSEYVALQKQRVTG